MHTIQDVYGHVSIRSPLGRLHGRGQLHGSNVSTCCAWARTWRVGVNSGFYGMLIHNWKKILYSRFPQALLVTANGKSLKLLCMHTDNGKYDCTVLVFEVRYSLTTLITYGRVRLGSSGLGLLRFRMTRSIRLSWIRMSHPSSSISSEKSTDEFGWAWHMPTPARGREGFTTPSFGSQSNGHETQLISSHLILWAS